MTEREELKPCPFCGGRAHMAHDYDLDGFGRFYFIKCGSCRSKGAESFASETCPIFFETVKKAWNRRAEG